MDDEEKSVWQTFNIIWRAHAHAHSQLVTAIAGQFFQMQLFDECVSMNIFHILRTWHGQVNGGGGGVVVV